MLVGNSGKLQLRRQIPFNVIFVPIIINCQHSTQSDHQKFGKKKVPKIIPRLLCSFNIFKNIKFICSNVKNKV